MPLSAEEIQEIKDLGVTTLRFDFRDESYDEVNLPVLYFLHGRSGNKEILEQLKINEVVSKLIKEKKIKPIIIVCP